jgi:hypothetical protein
MFGRVPRHLRTKIKSFDESGMDYWIVIVTLRDGRRFSNVYINGLFQLCFRDLCPFGPEDIVDVEWEGHRGSRSSSAPVPLPSVPRANGES